MTNKTLAIIFITCIIGGFFLAGFGDNSGNGVMLWSGIIAIAIGVAVWVKWWKNPNAK
jgi:hypothetical protein